MIAHQWFITAIAGDSPAETTLAQEGTTQGLLVGQGGTEHLSWWSHPNSRFTCLKLNPDAAVGELRTYK